MICHYCIHSDVCKDYSVYKDTIIACESFKDATEVNSALEKQIPKKVNNLEVFCDIGACIPKTKSGNCPVCNNFMIGNHTYCNDCGQALDWSDTE